jgi:imidazolonepropionase-like amidohydrolase
MKRREFLRSAALAGVGTIAAPNMSAEMQRPIAVTSSVPRPLALTGGTLITGTGAPAIADAVIVIEGKKIVQVGGRAEVQVPKNAEVLDMRGKFITPGLIDTNVHLVLMIVPEFYAKYEDRLEEVALQSAQVALKYGVTTVRDSWGPLNPLLKVRDRINRGDAVGSRTLVAGNIVGLGGPFSIYFLGNRGASSPDDLQKRINALWEVNMGPRLLLMTPDEVRHETQAYLDRGVDFVKVAVSAHGMKPEPLMFSPAVLRAMGEEVHKRGLGFESHTGSPESLRVAVEAGVDLLQHPESMGKFEDDADRLSLGDRGIPEDLIAVIKARKIFCSVLTASQRRADIINEGIDHDPVFKGLTKDMYRGRLVNLRKLIEAKAPITMSTDAGPQAPEFGPRVMSPLIGRQHFDSLQDLVALGMTPMDALVAATKRGAEACRRADLGTLEAGKLADLLVLRADPLQDISNMRQIDIVMKEGVRIDRDRLPENGILGFNSEAEWPKVR